MIAIFILVLAIQSRAESMQPGEGLRGEPSLRSLAELTLPSEQGGVACSLIDANAPDGSVLGSVWGRLSIRANPWTGTDPAVMASIVERMIDRVPVPDGPPLSARELAAFRLRYADGVEEGYAAVYRQSEMGFVQVFAVRTRAGTASRAARTPTDKSNRRAYRIDIGPVIAVVHGDPGPCFSRIVTHLQGLAR
jgi:hypothetical protein